ncbi:MAG: hypothetical protein J5729_02390 [Bacteroidaceae bacterium]|nr:hypothetical protein [Bacteroidaceae bacterium]
MTYLDDYHKTLDLLLKGQLLKAILQQKELIAKLQNWALMDEVVKTEQTYTMMLKFFSDGAEDERRCDIYAKTLTDTLAMAEKIKRQAGLLESANPYYSKMRTVGRQARNLLYYTNRLNALSGQSLFHDIISEDTEPSDSVSLSSRLALTEEMFDYIWVAATMTREEYTALEQIITGSILTPGERQWMVSALILSLLGYYDLPKLQLLVSLADAHDDKNSNITCCAMIGIALAAMYYRRRFAVQPPHQLFDFMPGIGSEFVELQLRFMIQYQTHRLRPTFDRDFMTLIMQMRGKISDSQLRDILEDEDPELPPGIDPEVIKNIQERLQKANDMAFKGHDMMYPYFKQLKAYPFFRETHNWLKPASVPTPDFQDTLNKLSPLFAYSNICDSDKHSLAATMASMPQTFGQIVNQQLKEVDGEIPNETHNSLPSILQDFYRYFTIRTNRDAEGNPFYGEDAKGEGLLLFIDSPLIKARIDEQDAAKAPRWAYNNRLYRHALILNQALASKYPQTDRERSRIAFCYAMLKDNQAAVDTFRSCKEIPHDMLALYASCLMALGQPHEATMIYERLMTTDEAPLYSYATALSQCGKFSEACKVLYKEDYVHPGQTKVLRLLAWCTLKSDSLKLVESRKSKYKDLYSRLLRASDLKSSDWFNAGHASLAEGDTPLAIQYYLQSGITTFTPEDRKMLIALGVSRLTLNLVEDVLSQNHLT